MIAVDMKSIFVLSWFLGLLAFASCSEGRNWAFVVAGSNGWYNCRHQADACHAYQILHKNGIPDERIVVMMYDDIAHNRHNPTPGVIINRPNGTGVYHGVPKDYTGTDVTPGNFLSILSGDADAMQGIGSGKVIASGPNDNVFVYVTNNGAPFLIAFPTSELHANDLLTTLDGMYNDNKYKQLVFYLEGCESGSMFDKHKLRSNIKIFTTTAANGRESSYACYYDKKRRTYLGDLYSVNWMEDSDVENLKVETLDRQFEIVRTKTNTSHAQRYGDISFSNEPVANFQGGSNMQESEPRAPYPEVPFDAIPQEDVPITILTQSYLDAETEEEKEEYDTKLKVESELRQKIHTVVSKIAQRLGKPEAMEYREDLSKHQCYKQAVTTFSENCFNLGQYEFALRRVYVFVNLCESGLPVNDITNAISHVCHSEL